MLPRMARSTDTYSAAQAANILGISERRVRQLVTQGKLPGKRATDGTVRIAQQAVNEERKRRKKDSPAAARTATRARARASTDGAMDVDTLADKISSAVGQRIEGQLEITRRAESLVRQELDEERARRMQLEAALNAAQQRVADLEAQAQKRGGLFRRK
jgi:excisionase family DNA binding protein